MRPFYFVCLNVKSIKCKFLHSIFPQCCGSGMFISDPGSMVKKILDPGSGSALKNISILT